MEDLNTNYRAIKNLAIENGYSQNDSHKLAETFLQAVLKAQNGNYAAYEEAYNNILKPLMD
ncbi:MAG: hypothetical protein GVY04_04920 [Cyanobacteria bacterium]|nr:hypothetical protein [Cyanobacteria bacterium GSL.Bin1]